ncbi:MAG: GNAT family N-acetyltransferase, partial [Actinobacteria bacterium]
MTVPGLPPGLTIGPVDPEADVDEVTAFMQRTFMAESGRPYTTRSEIETTLRMPGFDPTADSVVVRDASGAIVAVEWLHRRAPYVITMTDGCVAPERTGEGIGSYLLDWSRRRAAELVGDAPGNARVIFTAGVDATHRPSLDLVEGHGMRLRRYFLEMRVDFDGPVPPPVFPEGITIRNVVPGEDDVAIWRAMDDAFRDHFGHVEGPEEAGVARMRNWMTGSDFDPTLWWMAMDGDEYAANCWCLGSVEDDERIGYVANLGVRKPWRGRGLAKALLRYAFAEFQRRGKVAAT